MAFFIVLIGLLILKLGARSIWIALGVAVLDILPVVGSVLALLPWAIVCIVKGAYSRAIGLGIIYILLVFNRQILEPKIVGDRIGVRPLITFASIVLGTLLIGPLGLVLGPFAAVLVTSVVRTLKKIKDKTEEMAEDAAEDTAAAQTENEAIMIPEAPPEAKTAALPEDEGERSGQEGETE